MCTQGNVHTPDAVYVSIKRSWKPSLPKRARSAYLFCSIFNRLAGLNAVRFRCPPAQLFHPLTCVMRIRTQVLDRSSVTAARRLYDRMCSRTPRCRLRVRSTCVVSRGGCPVEEELAWESAYECRGQFPFMQAGVRYHEAWPEKWYR